MLQENALKKSWSAAKSHAADYKDDESGALIVFSLFIFMAMIVFGGVAVDMMIYENKRTNMQNSTDRAVLAAANLNQTVDPKVVVVDYLAKVGVTISEDDVTVEEVGAAPVWTGRRVAVNVEEAHETLLMNLVGVDSLPFSAVSEAEEAINDIEVSLVLDVSGSMGWNNKLPRLKTAAKEFVTDILAGAVDNRVSLSLVPYSTQVAVGGDFMNVLNMTDEHGLSHCANFQNDDMFETTSINHSIALEQTLPFDPWGHWSWRRVDGVYQDGLRYEVCRTEAYMDILPWSNSIDTINDQIDDFTAGGNTSIDVAFKWGAALLDPSLNTQLIALEAAGAEIDEEFTVRPHPHDYDDGKKFIVVMTDGINTSQYVMKDAFRTGEAKRPNGAKYYLHRNDIWMQEQEIGDRDGDGISNEGWYNLSKIEWGELVPEDDGTIVIDTLTWPQFWSQITTSRYAYAEYHQTWNSSDYWDNRYPFEYVTASEKDARLNDVCTAAKAKDIVVFTIGFEVTDHSAGVMRNCASSPLYFYRVEGLDIAYAFESIGNQINKLKLTN